MSGSLRLIAGLLVFVTVAAHGAEPALTATEHNPRAYGYFVGDVITRRIDVQLPDGLALDEDALPRAGRPGQALELRHVLWQRPPAFGSGPATLTLDYQVFIAPREVRTFEMPPVTLRFSGAARAQTLRIDAWPVTVAPLVPLDASPRHGLGELRPDAPPPLIDTRAARWRFAAYAVVAVLLLAYLAQVYIAWPWLARRARPFGRAWGDVRALSASSSAAQQRAAMQALHQALNLTAGQVLFENGVAAFVATHPRFRPMQAELADFFQRSRGAFFGSDADVSIDAEWLRTLCRRARDLERGAA
jgi:mxaA protein